MRSGLALARRKQLNNKSFLGMREGRRARCCDFEIGDVFDVYCAFGPFQGSGRWMTTDGSSSS